MFKIKKPFSKFQGFKRHSLTFLHSIAEIHPREHVSWLLARKTLTFRKNLRN